MKKIFFILITILLSATVLHGEIINLNPDPDGEPWLAGGLRELTDEDWEKIEQTPKFSLSETLRNRELPSEIDNSQHPYFRPIFNQYGGSCGQASGIAYNFTYEIDWERGLTADVPENQYPTHFTWNFFNGGQGGGSWYFDGWEVLKANGCPNIEDYGGHYASGGDKRWMSGYPEYYAGMHNRVLDYYTIDVSTPEGLETLKQWMNDHGDESEIGGLANFACGVSPITTAYLPDGTPEAGKLVATWWDPEMNHAMTFVGYNDSIRYDYNEDGQYTNHVDINNDGIVDMKDWEIGGLIVANSWGSSWGDDGKIYMMYKLCAEPLENGGLWNNMVHVMRAKETYFPYLTLKATIKHTSRNKLKIMAGVSNDTLATEPDFEKMYPLFHYQGGPFHMQGGETEDQQTIEIGLDITPLISGTTPGEPAKFFLQVQEQDGDNSAQGEIISYSIIDYFTGEEIICSSGNVPIVNDGITLLSVIKTVNFDVVQIDTESLPIGQEGEFYSHQLSASAGTPPYKWGISMDYTETEIAGGLPVVNEQQLEPSHNDDGFVVHPIDFIFPFYGELFEDITIVTDGSITFDGQFSYIRNGEGITSNKAITPYGSDLMIYPDEGDGIWYQGDDDSATFRWKTSRYNAPEANAEFAVTLYPSGEIEFFYGDGISETTTWASGISYGDGNSYTLSALSGSEIIPPDYATSFVSPNYPVGMAMSEDGIFSGIPTERNQSWNVIFRVTDYNNIFTTKTLTFSTDPTSDIDNPHLSHIPQKITLGQNYPNPFNPTTAIDFTLPKKLDVKLKIYDVSGRLVKTLIDKPIDAGNHSVTWKGDDETGNKVSSGIYYYRMESDKFKEIKSMILLK